MYLCTIDWVIVFVVAAGLLFLAQYTRKFSKTTADFLAANRVAGRYVLTMAEGMVGLSAIGYIGQWQVSYKVGLSAGWWQQLNMIVVLIIPLFGWVIYRFRETRALTLAQFLEMRYGKKLRIFAGMMCFTSGVLNYGIFPAAGANFFIYYCGLPSNFYLWEVELATYPMLVIILVTIALYFTFVGGQISVIMTDFAQGLVSNIFLVALIIFLLIKFPLSNIFEGLQIAEPGRSMVNPLDTLKEENFNPWYFIISAVGAFINYKAWQGSQAYNASAKSPHEAKMACILASFRMWAFTYGLLLLPLIAYAIMHLPEYADKAQVAKDLLANIKDPTIRDQMITPVTMTTFIPAGMLGGFAAMMFAAFISTNDTYIHSWGSIFVQDVVLPIRNRPLANKSHIWLLRLSTVGVAIFGIFWSLFVPQMMSIWMFFAITGAVWLGGAGIVIIGGLYTRWGTTNGAFAAIISGSLVAVTGLTLKQIGVCWLNGYYLTCQWIYFYAMVTSITMYILFSLLGKRTYFNLEKMLHRGEYVVSQDHANPKDRQTNNTWNWMKLIGISKECTRSDKLIYLIAVSKTLIVLTCFIVMTICGLTIGISDHVWSKFHQYFLWFFIGTSFLIAIWLCAGGIRDAIRMIKDLKNIKRDASDDGTVID